MSCVGLKCPGCRCRAQVINRRCPCCGSWPSILNCAICGALGDFNHDMVLTSKGTVHDACWEPYRNGRIPKPEIM